MNFINKLLKFRFKGSCCGSTIEAKESSQEEIKKKNLKKIAIVGSPNVGKSLIFSRLTGTYVTVSNYPGTTVEVYRGRTRIGELDFEVIDTPGMYSLLPITEEEKVAKNILFEERPDIVIHIIDAKNMERMLPLTLQLIEAELPIILVLNIIDEAEDIGMEINFSLLEKELKAPVVTTVATTGRGMDIFKGRIEEYARAKK